MQITGNVCRVTATLTLNLVSLTDFKGFPGDGLRTRIGIVSDEWESVGEVGKLMQTPPFNYELGKYLN